MLFFIFFKFKKREKERKRKRKAEVSNKSVDEVVIIEDEGDDNQVALEEFSGHKGVEFERLAIGY